MHPIALSQVLPLKLLAEVVAPFASLIHHSGHILICANDGSPYYGTSESGPVLQAPITVNQQVVGQVVFTQAEGAAPEQAQADYLARVLSHMAMEALQKDRLIDEVLARYDELNLIYDLGAKLSMREASDTEIIAAVLNQTQRIIKADSGAIYLYTQPENQKRRLEVVHFFGTRSDREFWMGRPLELARSTLHAFTEAQISHNGRTICAPLRNGDDLFGALLLIHGTAGKVFNANDVNLLTTLTHNTALFVQAAQLYSRLIQQNEALQNTLTELQSAKDELNRAERLSIVGQTISGLIHDMRTPLNTVMGYAGMLEEPITTREETVFFAEQINLHIHLFASLTQEILDYTNQETDGLKRTTVNLTDYLDEIFNMINPPRMKDLIRVQFDIQAPRDTTIYVDTIRFVRIFINLVNNARDALQEHGGSTIYLRAHAEQDKVIFRVEDDGPGIPLDKVDEMFEPLKTTKQRGTGLGLAIVSYMVKMHDGSIHYETSRDGGACFVVTIPQKP
jgi:signal transduction histidine kinase